MSANAASLNRTNQKSPADIRQHQRIRVHLRGRYMLADRKEYSCQVVDMSPGGAAFIAPQKGEIGEKIIAYIDDIGRIEGVISRHLDDGFAIDITGTMRKRDKLASQLTWLANRNTLNLRDERRHERIEPENPHSFITLPDGRTYNCRVIDVSLSGAALALDVRPAIGSVLTLGKMTARVVRHFEDGIAVEFSVIQSPDTLKRNIN